MCLLCVVSIEINTSSGSIVEIPLWWRFICRFHYELSLAIARETSNSDSWSEIESPSSLRKTMQIFIDMCFRLWQTDQPVQCVKGQLIRRKSIVCVCCAFSAVVVTMCWFSILKISNTRPFCLCHPCELACLNCGCGRKWQPSNASNRERIDIIA